MDKKLCKDCENFADDYDLDEYGDNAGGCGYEYCDGAEYFPSDDTDRWEEDCLVDGVGFAYPGGNSALRAETPDNPRDRPCPSCGAQNVLTRIDVQRGYQCDSCANRDERGGW